MTFMEWAQHEEGRHDIGAEAESLHVTHKHNAKHANRESCGILKSQIHLQ